MTEFEATFIAASPLNEAIEDDLMDAFDCIVGTTHDGDSFITLTTAGDDAVSAMKSAHMRLVGDFGVAVARVDYDLVTRGEIAARLDLTRQAVGNWTRGDRRGEHPFPKMFSEAAGGVWLWGDVVRWIREVGGEDPAFGLEFPRRQDIEEFNDCIRRKYAKPADDAVTIRVPSIDVVSFGATGTGDVRMYFEAQALWTARLAKAMKEARSGLPREVPHG